MPLEAHVDPSAGMAADGWAGAWTFDLDHWGACGQGPDEEAALAELSARTASDVIVVERLAPHTSGGEVLFERDRVPATEAERARTLDILAALRPQTVALLGGLPDEDLDAEDPLRQLPAWASWKTVRDIGWHVADCESRYYLPALGLRSRQPEEDLLDELAVSAAYVREVVGTMPLDLVGEEWSSVKLLRRLAWHEAGELEAMRDLIR